jgi:hypothetical protein
MATKTASPKFSPSQAQALFDKAHAAGMAAGEAHQPTPMHVIQRANPFDDSSPVIKRYPPVMGGVCGFAWVNISPGNSSFANWLRKNDLGHKSYYGGWDFWISGFGQSMECKEAYARAFAKVLKEAGIQAYAQSRID